VDATPTSTNELGAELMTEIQQAIDALLDADCCISPATTMVQEKTVEGIYKAIQALREYQKNNGWISVDEQLPELKVSPGNLTATNSKEYLVATNEGYVTLATWSQGLSGGGWVKNNKDDINEYVRYWKPKDKSPMNQESE